MKQGDIILVPFPFSDLSSQKTRPAVVVSNKTLKGEDVILVGVTSQKGGRHVLSFDEDDLEHGHLPKKSFIRFSKMASLKKTLVRKTVARLGAKKRAELIEALHLLFEIKE